MKTCGKCREQKPFSSFSRKAASRDGHSSKCKQCHSQYMREKWYPVNRERQMAASAKWKNDNRLRRLALRYETSEEEILRVQNRAGGKCEVCKSVGDLVIDHCHATGEIRGCLCNNCNLLLGRLGDEAHDIKRYVAAFLAYLEIDDLN